MEKNKIEKLSEKLISSREQVRLSFSETAFRLQTVLMHQGIEWINDSKSTTIETSAYSLEVIQKPVVWIVGANQQKQDFSLVEKLVRLKVCKIICFGNFDTSIKYSLSSVVDGYAYKNKLEDAIKIAYEWSKNGYAFLFSPACASGSDFNDYKHRGVEFNRLLNELL